MNEIQRHPLKLLTDSDSKSTYIPLSSHQNAICLRLSSYSQGSIGVHPPCPLPNFIQIQHHSSELLSDSDSKSIYIPLSCRQNVIPLRLSSFSQDSITTHSPCIPPNLIKIHYHSSKLLIDSNSKSTYIPLSCHQNAIPLRFSSFLQG